QGNTRDALLVCNKLLQINPRDPLAREKMGDIHLATGDKGEAVKAWLMAAHEYVMLQDKGAAKNLYQRILETDPSSTAAQRELANLG
ncbi:MAG: tetratricopeptide repeat protein, partial [Candidatus Xenobia bacterium]